MALLQRLLIAGLISGLAGGAALTLLQQLWVVPLIAEGERYEQGVAESARGPGSPAQPPRGGHGAGGTRFWVSLAANTLMGMGLAFVLAGAMALSGSRVNGWRGLAWGAAGFAVFTLAPALGVPPALPGGVVVPVAQGQLWWLSAAGASGVGLALLVFGGRGWLQGLGAGILLLPHLVGAPAPGPAPANPPPPELVRSFVVAALATSAVFWVVLGGVCGWARRNTGG